MSNNWFRFKQFTIRQDKTAMKVGTDGVLLGAWACVDGCKKILDAGTGTGLIALMLAQRCRAEIDAIEIDTDAAIQASENVNESLWADRINVIQISFQDFCNSSESKYDMIVCNPPFFKNSLKAQDPSRNLARHFDQLDELELFTGALKLLESDGHLCIIFPAENEKEIISQAKSKGFYPSKILRIRPTSGKSFKRILVDFIFLECLPIEEELTIETGQRHAYSEEYLNLTRDFYYKL